MYTYYIQNLPITTKQVIQLGRKHICCFYFCLVLTALQQGLSKYLTAQDTHCSPTQTKHSITENTQTFTTCSLGFRSDSSTLNFHQHSAVKRYNFPTHKGFCHNFPTKRGIITHAKIQEKTCIQIFFEKCYKYHFPHFLGPIVELCCICIKLDGVLES